MVVGNEELCRNYTHNKNLNGKWFDLILATTKKKCIGLT